MQSDGSIGLTEFDHANDTFSDTVVDSEFDVDDHNSPAIYRRDDGHLILFWTAHNNADIRYAISDNPLDASSFGSIQTIGTDDVVDYPQPVAWNSNIRLYYRYGGGTDSRWSYRESADNGQTWSSRQDVFDDSNEEWTYVHPYRDGSQIHFAMGDHRMTDTGIYHWYLEGGDYYESGGTLIQSADSAITSVSDLTRVYDGTASGNNPAKQYDLICDSNGNPHVAFTEHVSTGSGGGDGDYRARWGTWDGSQWVVGSEITPMGGALPETHYYEGGLSLDSQDPSTVYVSVEQDNRNYQIQEWTTDDGGLTWSKVTDLSPADATLTDPTKRGRPISPRGHDGSELITLWWAGMYSDYTNYDTQVRREQ